MAWKIAQKCLKHLDYLINKKILSNKLVATRIQLQTSSIPENLTCRDEQYDQIFNFCYDGLNEKTSGVLYVAGVPGTGKTATMKKVLQKLNQLSDSQEIDDFEAVHVNGMTLATPKNIFIAIYKQIFVNPDDMETDEIAHIPTVNECKRKISNYFNNKLDTHPVTILFVDELDLLQTRSQDVLYQIFDWPQKRNSKLLIVSIANTLDLPERLESSRVASRIGHSRIVFEPYKRKQLVKVIKSRIEHLALTHRDPTYHEIFQDDAIEFIARKITSVTGDARRCLDSCRLAVDFLIDNLEKEMVKNLTQEQELALTHKKVSVQHALKAVTQLFGGSNQNNPFNKIIKTLPQIDQLILKSITTTLKATGSDTVAVGEIWRLSLSYFRVSDILSIDSKILSKSCVNQCLQKLCVAGIIDVDNFRLGPLAKVRLLLRSDDILFALEWVTNYASDVMYFGSYPNCKLFCYSRSWAKPWHFNPK